MPFSDLYLSKYEQDHKINKLRFHDKTCNSDKIYDDKSSRSWMRECGKHEMKIVVLDFYYGDIIHWNLLIVEMLFMDIGNWNGEQHKKDDILQEWKQIVEYYMNFEMKLKIYVKIWIFFVRIITNN